MWKLLRSVVHRSAFVQYSIHRVAKPLPLDGEAFQRFTPFVSEVIVAAWRSRSGLAPRCLDASILAQPAEQWIDRSFCGHDAVEAAKFLHQFESVPLVVADERHHAVLQSSLSHLGDHRVVVNDLLGGAVVLTRL